MGSTGRCRATGLAIVVNPVNHVELSGKFNNTTGIASLITGIIYHLLQNASYMMHNIQRRWSSHLQEPPTFYMITGRLRSKYPLHSGRERCHLVPEVF